MSIKLPLTKVSTQLLVQRQYLPQVPMEDFTEFYVYVFI